MHIKLTMERLLFNQIYRFMKLTSYTVVFSGAISIRSFKLEKDKTEH